MISEFDDLVWKAVYYIGTPLTFKLEDFFALINAVIKKESSFNPQAISYTGAGIGLMQVNPFVWKQYSREQLFNPETNINAGTQILKDYIQRYGTSGGLGAYFAGPSNRLTSQARNYAQSVLSFYSNIKSSLRSTLSNLPSFYFIDPGASSLYLQEELPEVGTEPEYVPSREEIITIQPIYDSTLNDPIFLTTIVGLGVLIIWANNQ